MKRIEKMIAEGLMTEAGLAKLPPGVRALPAVSTRTLEVPPLLAEALAANLEAQRYFDTLAPSYRRNYIHWITDAKREQTRRQRSGGNDLAAVPRQKTGNEVAPVPAAGASRRCQPLAVIRCVSGDLSEVLS